ncbi:hemerythrin domain-containing protein [Bordetella sp. 02P26C-1]|uniref:hemerythrin domain-containing protein n=1 Tax=Bordetella sp. 02P26C-1 TaxID=2683195 RepID=UPI0013549277|nr:hemerythrin domain-containing protein [Bordetella sp. 02P26C-1]MVW80229.1 hemerythrin domain-containing protein [Bordetella sp. 02P26C-1]
MAIDIPGYSSPAAGLDTPLALLSACHERMTRQCETLLRLAAHVAQHGSDEVAQTAAASVMRYFDTAARLHHRDEEEDLFPALIESMSGSDARCIHEIVDALTQDHRRLERLWDGLHPALEAISAGRHAQIDKAHAECFCAEYAAHLRREDEELLPMASRLLDDVALSDMSQAMRARRGGDAS